MNSTAKNMAVCGVLIAVAVLLYTVLRTTSGPAPIKLSYSQFLQEVNGGQVLSATVEAAALGANRATLRMKDGRTLRTLLPHDDSDALRAMLDKSVSVEIEDSPVHGLAWNAMPFLVLLIVWIIMFVYLRYQGPRVVT